MQDFLFHYRLTADETKAGLVSYLSITDDSYNKQVIAAFISSNINRILEAVDKCISTGNPDYELIIKLSKAQASIEVSKEGLKPCQN